MRITLNGRVEERSPTTRVADLLPDPRGCAVAVNGQVVPREHHAAHLLADGDVVEVVTAVQGG
ncbi:thiamine biosynthesis protein ThiS [Nocardioides gansuensis]|uniref:Thiamine biosynthesis protein ThiS n=1 Tax=Nocardioides gansuensis TaxID=2138300 RepID=A0A2T8F7E7_9ACTN|nr:sulfur carrier protein ThiS [Nocardioides gansuensis]PVG81638.1 thiamine biosynthesis protein ThiS [Nocardioides gansuensis]